MGSRGLWMGSRITPKSIRMRKRILNTEQRKKLASRAKQ